MYLFWQAEVSQTDIGTLDSDGKWEVKHSSVQIVQEIGMGFFCTTYEGIWNGIVKAAIRTPRLTERNSFDSDFIEEAAIMKQLRHPNIIQLYATCLREKPLYILTEFMKHGSLYGYFHSEKKALLTKFPKVIYDISIQVAMGMAHMEQQNCIHRNLSSQAILVGENLFCKVANFSCAKKLLSGRETFEASSSEAFKPPLRWMAPETFHHRKYSIKSDVWSFGILLYEIATCGQMPYAEMTDDEIIQQTKKRVAGLRIPCPQSCPNAIYHILLNCRRSDPSKRPTFERLVQVLIDNI